MIIDALSETEIGYDFDIANHSIHWNGHDIQKLEGRHCYILNMISTRHESQRSLEDYKIHKKPNMARPPDESEAEAEVGWDENRGFFVEGKITWTWKDSEDRGTSSEGTKASDSTDSNDRNLNKDVDK